METKPPQVVDEVYGFIKVLSDGSVFRPPFPGGYTIASSEFVDGVATRDISIADSLSARLFLPQPVSSSHLRAPVVLHFHGGGLCSGSPSATAFHNFCSRMSLLSHSIWISVDYRLAPEHRLPAAYDDAFTALMWLQNQSIPTVEKSHLAHVGDGASTQMNTRGSDLAHDGGQKCEQKSGISEVDPWLYTHADFSNCFLAGESSGGAIVHYLAMRIVGKDLTPVNVRGLLIIHAALLIKGMMSTAVRSEWELRPGTYRRLALPIGAPLHNPLVDPLHPEAPSLMHIEFPPALVAVAEQDELCQAASHYAHVLKQHGHDVELHQTLLQGHCFYLINPWLKESKLLFHHLAEFIRAHCLLQQCHSSL